MSRIENKLLLEKFGKSFEDIKDLKTSFFSENNLHLTETLESAAFYLQQPRRIKCKICNASLGNAISFWKHQIPYVICPNCSHLNGCHEDTSDFCKSLYTSNDGGDYAKNYSSDDEAAYLNRRDAIYKPKAEFMIETLSRVGESATELSYLDVGAGAGYFISALKSLDIESVVGYEVGSAQVEIAGQMLGSDVITKIDLDDTARLVREASADVISFIGVFEHLQNLREILRGIKHNRKVRYFYFCVPLFSSCIFNEMAFPNVMPRQLAKGHTHLFTKKSIDHFFTEFGFEAISAWWFGTDIMDYYRSIFVSLHENTETEKMADTWLTNFHEMVDDLQLVIDKNRESSQVHIFAKCCDND